MNYATIIGNVFKILKTKTSKTHSVCIKLKQILIYQFSKYHNT
jgi:hypothetical protein